jgi:hypothetical protein
MTENEMKKRLNYEERLIKRLVPDFPVGCRRLGPAEGFLEAMKKPNVVLPDGNITSFTEKGIITDHDEEFEVDVIICATGFDVSFRPHFPIIGQDSISLSDHWAKFPEAYLAMAASKFPNFMSKNLSASASEFIHCHQLSAFSLILLTAVVGSLGPNCPAGHGSFITVIEAAQNYICKIIRKVQIENIKSIHVKPSVIEEYNEHVQLWLKRT